MASLNRENPSGGEGPKKEYKANCHCGKIKLIALAPDLSTTRPFDCDCSICSKNGYLLLYVRREDVTFVSGLDEMTSYVFASRPALTSFADVWHQRPHRL
ncbi:hypothetical protein P152DRAFT_458719 [Eremomyces bilateralis CBS 781.70]|uniref:CENP-V/GFA domain-containing protein n=1 Tax=Eremomyces bilateralis CBS 781.70 TaxID=1392243 RepID=A0A6G1G2S2_9PEZI|nr:uncharacterized protein P152DRAFT_458719 [Eremomyces bilateralis CBS 781.70]KAF1812343.1 hypothetical protein P152DRAFT_458719 [Eremomyces bilateralis CBS 781.70]